MKKLLIILSLFVCQNVLATSIYELRMQPPYVYCEGEDIAMWFENTNSGPQYFYFIYEVYDQNNNLIGRKVASPSNVSFSNLSPGTYCVWATYESNPSDTLLSPVGIGDQICFEVLSSGVNASLTPDKSTVCVGENVCFSLDGVNNYSVSSRNFGSASAQVSFNQANCAYYSSPGVYNVSFSIVTPCGNQTVSTTITVENCKNCLADASFSYTRSSCNVFNFTPNYSTGNFYMFETWIIDGQESSVYPDMELSPGKHTICRSVMVHPHAEASNTCCDMFCVEIDIPVPSIEHVYFEICGSPGNVQGYPFSAEGYAYYTLTDPNPNDWFNYTYSSINDNDENYNEWWALQPDYTYEFNFYDENGCIVKTRYVEVTSTMFEILAPEYLSLEFCPLTGATGAWYRVCDYFSPLPANYSYVINDPVPGDWFDYNFSSKQYAIDNGGVECIHHYFVAGTYEINFYDEDNCTQRTLFLTSSPKPATATICSATYYHCDIAYDLEGLFPIDCPSCYDISRPFDFEVTNIEHIGVDPLTGANMYAKTITDRVNCNECTFYMEFIDEVCDFEPSMFVGPVNGDVLSYDYIFNRLDQTDNLCGEVVWTIERPGFPDVVLHGDNQNYHFDLGGYYEVSLTVCKCLCDRECCKTITQRIQVDRTVGFEPPFDAMGTEASEPANGNEIELLDLSLELTPNPSQNFISVQSLDGQAYTFNSVEIFDLNGIAMLSLPAVQTNQDIDISFIPSGLYLVKVIHHPNKIYELNLVKY